MVSNVEITDFALNQLDEYVGYIIEKFKNDQAAKSVLEDARFTKNELLNVADSLKYCEDSKLKELGYKTIHFRKHRYFFVFRIVNETAFIEAVYHDLQDYENIFIKDVVENN
jgi:plasmid stabilization system protein ParE